MNISINISLYVMNVAAHSYEKVFWIYFGTQTALLEQKKKNLWDLKSLLCKWLFPQVQLCLHDCF